MPKKSKEIKKAPKKKVASKPTPEVPKPEPASEKSFEARAKEALANAAGVPVAEVPDPDGKGNHLPGFGDESKVLSWGDPFGDGRDYVAYDGLEEAERVARESVKQDLENEPEIFSQDWLSNHLYVSDTDRRIIAGEEADNYVDDVLSEKDLLEEARMDSEYDEAETSENQAEMDRILSEAREAVHDRKYEEVYSALRDPIDYFVNELGAYTVEDLLKASFIQIDYNEAADDAVATDGYGHFVDGYDNNPHEDANGVVICKW